METCSTDSKGRQVLSPGFYDETLAYVHRTHYKLPGEDEPIVPCKFLTFWGSREHFPKLYDFEDFRMAVILLNERVAEIRGRIRDSQEKKVSIRDQSGRNIEIKSLDYVFFPIDFPGTSIQDARSLDDSLEKMHESFSGVVDGKLVVVILDPMNAMRDSKLKGTCKIDLGYFLSGIHSQ
jgi:hypothetical protein